MRYHCCELARLEVIKLSGSANGIEFIEVRDHLEPDPLLRQRTLFVRLLRPGFTLGPDNLRIDGGERIPEVAVEWVAPADALPAGTDPALVDGIDDLPRTLVVRTRSAGDFARYTLHLLANSGSTEAPAGFDPILSSIEFSFKVECPSDFDCADAVTCPPTLPARPDIDYLAKDYPGFRRLMLDRMNLRVPGWTERSAADVGITLVELLAYLADNLSYRQDAIANEAYLGTARRRISVRRHARLVDYRLHDGCNARAWVHLSVTRNGVVLTRGAPLLTRGTAGTEAPTVLEPGSKPLTEALAAGATVFETAHDKTLHRDLNRLAFYTWGERGCCLPRGATAATLLGALPLLAVGDVLVFKEVFSPTSFDAADADRAKRCAVRLTSVKVGADPSGGLFVTPSSNTPLDITEIEWDAADALPFPLCLSVIERPGLAISAALGNIVLADHGRTLEHEALGTVPAPRLLRAPVSSGAHDCVRADDVPVPVRFRPAFAQRPLSQGFDLAALLAPTSALPSALANDDTWAAASALLQRDPHEALPLVKTLTGRLIARLDAWHVQRDLLASDAAAHDFVVETEDDGRATLRFGDDTHGRRPEPGTVFTATYRVGNGVAGNIGADAIAHIVSTAAGDFEAPTNPMAAAGGIEPEPIEAVRRDAPEAFRTQERAVTAADYAAAAERRAEVQRAAASLRWTGSWHTVFVTADRLGGAGVDAPFEARLRRHLERFRMAGYDLEVDAPHFVALDIELHLCVLRDYLRADVLRAVRAVLGSGVLADGRLGAFHPDNFSFGEPVYLSRIIAAAQAVEGVESVVATRFARRAAPGSVGLAEGLLRIGRLEIARLDNNPNFPERGRLVLTAGGGK